MNYRHAYHAGNFADVLKHAVLARILVRLRDKPAPFRVIDTHAGAGAYDLTGPEAAKTGAWRDGIGRLLPAAFTPVVRDLLAPYLQSVAALNPDRSLARYPGSPLLVRDLLRSADRLTACELEPGAARALGRLLRRDRRIGVVAIDGWTALGAYLPPPERRGLVLIDPPFENPGEFDRLAKGLAGAHRKWPTGIYLLWYPLKEAADARAFAQALRRLAIAKILRAELHMGARPDARLAAAGLMIVNPPWRLDEELTTLLPALAALLGAPSPGGFRLDWLAAEK